MSASSSFNLIFISKKMGVPTQCLKSTKVLKANMQYWANVLLKYLLHSRSSTLADNGQSG